MVMDAEVISALELQRAGRFADAARAYHAVLEKQHDHPEALHLFGVMHHQNGYHARAVELIGRAISARPGAAAFHANLAEACRALGKCEEAVDSCRTALSLQPIFPEAANNLGLALHDLGRFDEAVAQFQAAIEMRPGFAVVHNNLGTSLRELGRFGEALAAYRKAVELDAGFALARSNLGQLLVDQGQLDEGLTHALQAVGLAPNASAAFNNLGNAYRALERWTEAHAAYDQALNLEGRSGQRPGAVPQILANRGLALFLEGRRNEGFASFREAVDLAPQDAAMWRHLANAHEADDDHAAALGCRQKMVELSPQDAAAHNAMGWSLQEEGRTAEAAASYARALELNPRHIEALLNRGGLHEELGEMRDAESRYRQAHALHPGAPSPLARLAQLLRGRLPEADINAIHEQLGTDGAAALPAGAPARGPLLFGLAQVHDAQGRYAEAARCLESANALSRELRRLEGKRYDPASHSELVDRIIAGFTPQLFGRLGGAERAADSRLPVFVFGMPRSGTTLVEQVLASHSRVMGAGELRAGRDLFESIPALVNLPDEMLSCLAALDAAAVCKLRSRHLDALHALKTRHSAPAAERIVDKMPDNYLYLGLLALLFPRATFIHVRRDLRDVATSCWMTNFRSIRWADDQENLARRCQDYVRLMDHWRRVLPVTMHEVQYENLIDEFETEAPRLVSACGLEWEPGCGQFHQTARPVRTASVTQVRQPLYRKSVARWKHYEQPLAELFARLPT